MIAASHYNVVFSGDIAPGVAAAKVRQRVQAVFRLTDEQRDRLFSGHRMVVKRNLDLATALRLGEAFRSAGALARIESATDGRPVEPPDPAPPVSRTGKGAPVLTLAPVGPLLDELDAETRARPPDPGHLRLVVGSDWSLEDCAPAPAARLDLSGETFALLPVVQIADDDTA